MNRSSLGIALASVLATATVSAAPIIVDTVADGGGGSLREAIKTANLNAGPDVIEFAIPTRACRPSCCSRRSTPSSKRSRSTATASLAPR